MSTKISGQKGGEAKGNSGEEELKRARTFRFNKILLENGSREFVGQTVITIELRWLTGPSGKRSAAILNAFIRNKTLKRNPGRRGTARISEFRLR